MKFSPQEDEKIYIEGRSTFLKSNLKPILGYAFLTSKSFVFVGANSGAVFSEKPYDEDILFSIDIEDIVSALDAKHGFAKKVTIFTKSGDEYPLQFDQYSNWFELLKDTASLQKVVSTTTEVDDDVNVWYYEDGGQKVGPLSSFKVKKLAENNHTIFRFTKVWREGMSEWKKAEETEILSFFKGPPPLTGDSVNNTIVWILAFAPIIGKVIGLTLGAFILPLTSSLMAYYLTVWLIPILLNIILAILDERKLAEAGHNIRALQLGAAWLVPIYLFNRAKALKQNFAYLIVWIISFLLIL